MAFKISLLSDVAGFLKGTKSVEDALDDVADSLDDVARETAADAEKAAETLEREFKDAFDAVKTEAKQAGRKVGDEVRDGTRKAGDGFDDMKGEAQQTTREVAASFGSVEDALDGIQELAANALSGFGAAGAAAGAAVAIGLGLAKTALEGVAEDAEESKDRVIELSDALAEVDGNPAALTWAERLRDTLNEISDAKEWFEVWQNEPITGAEKWVEAARAYGLELSDIGLALTGDKDALDRLNAALDAHASKLTRNSGSAQQGALDYAAAAAEIEGVRGALNAQAGELERGIALQKDKAQILSEVTRREEEAAAAADAQGEAQRRQAEAAAEAQQASQQWSDALTDHLSVADEGLDRFVTKGKLNLKAWADELKARVKDTEVIEDFSVTIAPKLSPEALAAFAELPAQTQAQIAKAYTDGSKKDRKKVIANLEAEAKVTAVTLDTSDAQAAAAATPIEVPTTIITANLPDDVHAAANQAQQVANQASNEIEFSTRIDTAALQRQVDRAAAGIRPPVIYATVKPRKEVP